MHIHVAISFKLTSEYLFDAPGKVDQIIDGSVTVLVDAGKKLLRSRYRKKLEPLWNSHLIALKKQKVECFCKWKESGLPRCDHNFLFINHEHVKKYFLKDLKKSSKGT